MKLLPSIIVSGIALVIALLLCLVIDSPTAWVATWIACVVYGMVVLGTALYIAIGHSTDRLEKEIRRNLDL